MQVLALIFAVVACVAADERPQYSGGLRQTAPDLSAFNNLPLSAFNNLAQLQELSQLLGVQLGNQDNIANLRGIIGNLNEETMPVLDKATKSALSQLTDITGSSIPLLEQMTYATLPAVEAYTEALRKYNQEGGAFPQPPQQLNPFGLFASQFATRQAPSRQYRN